MPPSDWRTRAAILGGTVALMFALAELTERRKATWQRWIAGACRGMRARLGSSARA